MEAHLGASGEQEFLYLTHGEEEWKPAFELGITAMNVFGDPTKPGIYVIRLNWPANVMSLPHTHPEDRHVTVISGTWWAGVGETFDPDTAVAMTAGDHMFHPAGGAHWDGAKSDGAVIEITGYGPTGLTPCCPTETNEFTTI